MSCSKTSVFTMSYALFFKNNSFYNELCSLFSKTTVHEQFAAEPGRRPGSRKVRCRARPPARPTKSALPSPAAGPAREKCAGFYTLFKNLSFYNEFGYFAIEVSVFTMNFVTCFFGFNFCAKVSVFTTNSTHFSKSSVFTMNYTLCS